MSDLSKVWDNYIEKYQTKSFENLPPKTGEEGRAEEFLFNLINEGRGLCDDRSDIFNEQFQLPPYYDQKLFKKGQMFFHKHMAALCFGKILGLTTLLSAPSAAILSMSKQSSTPSSAFKRYTSTLLHVLIWYQEDLKPGSKFWASLKRVRSLHNSISKKSNVELNFPIIQNDMSATLFGFMGYAITSGERIGLYNVTTDELEGFIHFWRVIGYMLGIEDRFNLCKDSVEETTAVCVLFKDSIFKLLMENPYCHFQELTSALYGGLKWINPWISADVHIYFIHMLLNNTNDLNLVEGCFKPLSENDKSKLRNMIYFVSLFRFGTFRVLVNCCMSLFFKILLIV